MKKYLLTRRLLLIVFLALMLAPSAACARAYADDRMNVFFPFNPPDKKINLVLDGMSMAPPASLVINQAGRTIIDAGEVAGLLGLQLEWADNEQLQLSRGQVCLSFRSGQDSYLQGEKIISLDTVPFKTSQAFFIPLRVVAEEFGCTIDYDPDSQTVFLSAGITSLTSFLQDAGPWGPILPDSDLSALLSGHTLAGGYFTRLNNSPPNRNNNIILACAQINGTIIRSGDIFSFNQVVGPRSREKGYLPASIFVGQKVVPGIGGGICQVSSTIYNGALITGLKIIERHPHTLAVNYVIPGYDASVHWGAADFRFQNNRDKDLQILSSVNGSYVVVLLVEVH